jgi:hypothetical protein
MPATLPLASPVRLKRAPAGWARLAADLLHLAPESVEFMVHGPKPIHIRLAAIIRGLAVRGEVELLAKIEAELDAARAGLAIPEFSDEIIAEAVEADEEEAIARDRYLLKRSHDSLKRWRIAQETARGRGFLLLLATQRHEAEVRP